jgi:hypothetical protein
MLLGWRQDTGESEGQASTAPHWSGRKSGTDTTLMEKAPFGIASEDNRKMCSLYLMNRFGVKLDQFGDSQTRYSDRRTIGRPYVIRIAVMTFGAGLTVSSFDLVVPLTTGPVFLPASTFFSMATVSSPSFDLAAFRTIIKQLGGHASRRPKKNRNQKTAETARFVATRDGRSGEHPMIHFVISVNRRAEPTSRAPRNPAASRGRTFVSLWCTQSFCRPAPS